MSQEFKVWHAVDTGSVKGRVEVKKPSIVERFRFMEETGFQVNDAGQVATEGNKLRAMGKMIETSLPFILAVELAKADGTSISEVEEMTHDSECDPILMEIGGLIIGGFKPTKKLKP